jgi:hypothetical protein
MENMRGLQFALLYVVYEYARSMWRIKVKKINVPGEYNKSILPYSPYTPININRTVCYFKTRIKIYLSSFIRQNIRGRKSGNYIIHIRQSQQRRLFYFVSVIINYDFDLSVFRFPESGVKI